jgi:hypothetical protein
MIVRKAILIAAFVSIMPLSLLSQQLTSTENNDDADKLEKSAVELLQETQAEVEGLRLAENRISFSSELASLMWYHDEREARAMFAGVMNDFRQMMAAYDSQMNQLGPKPADEPEIYGPMSMTEPSERQKVERKFRVAVSVRQSIATSMAEHDPELALNFFYDSLNAVSNADLRRQMENSDKYFEQQLLDQVAAIDPAKAAQLAKKALEKGFTGQQVELLKKLYPKDADKAIDLGASFLAKIKSESPGSLDLTATSALLKYGAQVLDQSRTTSGKKTIYSDSDLKDIAEALAQAVLARPNDAGIPFATYAKDVERFQPGRAIQIRAKVQARTPNRSGPPTFRTVNTSATLSANSNSSPAARAAAAAQAQREASEKRMMADIAKVGSGKLTTEQKEKVIQQSRTTIASMTGRDKKVTALSLLAAQVAKAGDKELAAEIMRDAASYVNAQPKNVQDFMLSWLLTTGYATVDPEKAFPMLDDMVSRGNDLIEAAIKVAEFIDTSEEIVSDGELQVGAFGGSMIRGLTKELGMAESTLQTLSKTDFQKMKSLTNRFDRSEVRVLAKMLVLRAVLGNKPQKQPSDKTVNFN